MKVVMKPVDMIAHFPMDGLPRPMRFHVKDENGEYLAINIDRVLTRSEEKVGREIWLLYRCECIVNDKKRLAEFKYENRTCRWYLLKMTYVCN